MLPIHRLLSRIRWDRRFGAADFAIGYYDRVARRLLVVPLREVDFPPADRRGFTLTDAEGCLHRIPLHRVRAVWRDGRLIWQRPPRTP